MFSPNKKIVVVDDSILNLRIIEKYLGNNYIEIIKCSDSQKALDIIKQELPDLVLLDIHMPNLTGIDLLKQMRQDTLLSFIPVIFVTASEEKVHLQLAYNLGTVDYIHKPIVKEELIAKVQNYLFYIEEKNILQRYYNIIDEFVLTLITDTEDIVLYVSAAFTKRTDFDKVDILGCSFTELLIQNSEEKLWEDIKFTLTEQSIWKGKIRIKTKNHFFWADTVIQKIYDIKNLSSHQENLFFFMIFIIFFFIMGKKHIKGQIKFIRRLIFPVVQKHYPSKANREKMKLYDLITFAIMAHLRFDGVYKKAYRVLIEELHLYPEVKYNKILERLLRYENLLAECLELFELDNFQIVDSKPIQTKKLPRFARHQKAGNSQLIKEQEDIGYNRLKGGTMWDIK
jgi:CheY-like chemotaxis protein